MTKPRCYLDVEIDNEPAGRIVVELFNDICPITCENFRALCTGEKGLGQVTKKPLWYKNTLFHRVVKNFVIQSGDFEAGNGTGGESIFGGQFDDENFILSHDKPFLLSMANKGKNTNGSQFFITLQASPHLDKLHTVFGHVISGHEVIKQIENIKTDQNSKPLKEVKIAQCGELVLRSEKRKKRKESTSESSSSEEEKRKKKKKHKKEKKKSKREKKSKGFYSSSNKAEDDIACNVDPDEIPAVPANVFLMRRTSPVTEFRRTPRGRENYQFKRGPPSRTRSGRKVKGRGNMRYRTPSSSDERSGSETPPHWKQAQSRLKKLKEVIKDKDKNSDSELSNGEDDENKNLHNPFLQSRLGLVSSRNFDDERRKEKDARMNINESRRRRDYSQESRHNRDNDEPENLFEKLMQEDERHGNSWFDGNNQDQSDEEAHSSPLRSKIVVKSSVSKRDSRSNRRGDEKDNYRGNERDNYRGDERDNYRGDERDNYRGDERDNYRSDERGNYRRYNESSRRRDSPSDRRSRTHRRDSSSGHDNSCRKSNHHSENKRETNKNSNEKKNEKPKELSGKSQKRLNRLENDLFRYTKQEPKTTPKDKDTETNEEENIEKSEEIIIRNSVSSVPNSNLAALKEYETKSNEKCGHESNDSIQTEVFTHEPEKDKHKTEDIVSETVSVTSNIENHESQQSPLMQNVVDYKLEEELESNLSTTKITSNNCQSEDVSIPIPGEEPNKELELDEKDRTLSNNFQCNENKIKVENFDEKSEQKVKHSEKEEKKLINSEKQNDYNLPEIIPLPDEREDDNKKAKDILLKKVNETEMQTVEEKEIETQNLSTSVKVAENSSVDLPETASNEFQNKEKKIKQESRKKTSPQRHSPSSSEELRKSSKKGYKRMSVSPPRSKSPSHHKTVKRRVSKSPDNPKASSSKQSRSPYSRRSKSPVNRAKSPISQRKRSNIRRSKSRSRSRSIHRSISRNRGHRKYSRSPDVRPRRSRTRSHSRSRNVGRGSRSYRQSGVRNRSPELRSSFQRRNKSPFRGRVRGRSASRRSNTRSRSHSTDKRRRRRRQVSSSSSSSSSSSRSDNVKRRNKKKQWYKK